MDRDIGRIMDRDIDRIMDRDLDRIMDRYIGRETETEKYALDIDTNI